MVKPELGYCPISVKGYFPIGAQPAVGQCPKMDSESLRKRILQAKDEYGLSVAEIARRAGLKYDNVRDLLRRPDSTTSVENATRIAKALGITEDAPLVRVEHEDPTPEGSALIPVYEVFASAGPGAVVEHEPHSHSLAFPPDYLRSITSVSPKFLAIISVKGDSMEPTLPHGSIVMLDMSKQSLGYDGLFVIRIDDTLHVKRIGRSAQAGNVLIISDNPRHRDLDMPVERIEPVGKVLWYGREA